MSTMPIKKEDLIEEIHRLSDELDKRPSVTDMNRHGRYSHMPYVRAFGSWNEALKAAGVERVHSQTITEKDLLDDYLKAWEELGKAPPLMSVNELTNYSHQTYLDRFSTVETLRNKARAYKAGIYEPEETRQTTKN